jgi:uncharacterized membrane protein YeaQ/YmgE (transglycosylase-associated protein family)
MIWAGLSRGLQAGATNRDVGNRAVTLIPFLLIGLGVAWLAGKLFKQRGSRRIANLVVGAIGALIGGFVFAWLGVSTAGLLGISISATTGAVIFLFFLALVRRMQAGTSRAIDTARTGDLHTPRGSVFISYRRDRGSEAARLIQKELESRGWNVFLDVDDLRSSYFDERLLREIDKADNFVIILSPEALNRCSQEDDFLRKEIAHALARKKRIVPIIKDGFSFPDNEVLPADIRELSRHNGIRYSHDFFQAAMDKLVSFLAESGR